MSLDAIFANMPAALDSAAAAGVDAVIQYDLSSPRYVTIADGACTVSEGTHDDPRLTITMEEEPLEQLLTGELDGMQAFMTGQIQIDGDMMFAQQIAGLFDVNVLKG